MTLDEGEGGKKNVQEVLVRQILLDKCAGVDLLLVEIQQDNFFFLERTREKKKGVHQEGDSAFVHLSCSRWLT